VARRNFIGLTSDCRLVSPTAATTVIEPGWRGYLTLEITAHSQEVTLIPGMPIAQVLFHQLDREVEGYNGKYQDQSDHPVEAM
jgi:dCTP deaminase